MQRHGVIVGQGRSGTNWLLQLFDLSRETFCRNEPDECPGSAFEALLAERDRNDTSPDFGERWDAAAAAALRVLGDRDHRAKVPKRFLHAPARQLGLYRALRSPRFRRAAGAALPQLRRSEFPLPRWVGSSTRLAECFGVLKLNMAPGLAAGVLRTRPAVPVFHIVRHPGGYLQSWRSRYMSSSDRVQVEHANRDRLALVRRENADWAKRLPEPDGLDLEALELWYWRFANELIHAAGRERPAYRWIAYEELARDPVGLMRPLYAAADLPFTPEIERAITRTASASREIAGRWREKLDERQRRLVGAILDGLTLPIAGDV